MNYCTNNSISTLYSMKGRQRKPPWVCSIFCLLVISLFSLAVTIPAGAATYYLDAVNGDDTNPGTSDQPWQTISRAQSIVSGGDTVILKSGDYGTFTENVSRTDWITYRADDGHSPSFSQIVVGSTSNSPNRDAYLILEGLYVSGSNPVRIQRLNYVQIKDCDIQSDTIETGEGVRLWSSNHVTIEGNKIHHAYDCILLDFSSYNTIKNNDIYDVGRDGIRGAGSHYLVEGNTIHDLHGIGHADGIQVYTETAEADDMRFIGNHIYDGEDTQGLFITVENVTWTNVVVANNLIHDIDTPSNYLIINGTVSAYVNNNTIICGESRPGSGNTAIRTTNHRDTIVEQMYNNIFESFTFQADNSDAVAWVKEHGNNIFGNNPDFVSDRTYPFQTNASELTDVDVDLLFEDAANQNYQLASGSSAIDFGTPLYGPAVDIVNNTRDASPDAGCYEYQPLDPDTTAPSIPQNLTAQAVSESRIDLSWDASSDPESGVSYYKIYRDGSQIDTSVSTSYSNTGLNSGTTYSYEVLAVNGAGLESALSDAAQATTSSDTTAPSIVSVSASETALEVTFNESLDTTSAEQTSNYSINNGISITAASLNTSTVTLTTSSHTVGTYTLTVTNVQDTSGNTMTETTQDYEYDDGLVGHWKFDDGSGSSAVDSSGSNNTGTLINGPTWTTGRINGALNFDGIDDAVQIGASNLSVSSGTIGLWVYAEGFASANQYLLSHATQPWANRIQLYTDDASGNLDLGLGDSHTTQTDIQDLDTNTWYHIALTWNGTNYVVYINGQAEANGAYTGLSTLETYADIGNNGYSSDRSEAFNGVIDEVRVYDRVLTAAEVLELYNSGSGSETNNAPVLSSIGDKSVNENSALSFSVSATDADNDTIVYSATGLPTGATFASQTFTWTPDYTQSGTYQVTFTASDGTDSDSETITITVSNTNRAPVLSSIGDKSVNENSALSFSVNATDADGDTITYSATGLPTDATFVSQTFSWTPDYTQAGTYQVTFTASDGTDSDSETITITVSNTNRTPELSSIGDKSVNENSTLSFSVAATDADEDTITYSVQNLPSGAVFASQTFTWTPGYDQAGSHQVTFVASDGQAQDSETITITVNNINRAPELSSIGDKSVYTGSALSFSVSATDVDDDTLTYSATGLPSGATFANQNFSWTPGSGQTGSYDVTFTVSDGQAQDSETITITVAADTSAPIVSNLSPVADSIQVPLNSLISLGISDNGKGVDASTVTIRVNSNLVYAGNTADYSSSYGHCRRVGTNAAYTYVYQADETFDYDQTITVTVNATDLAANAMDEYSYSFRTEMRLFGENKKANSSSNNLNDGNPATASDSGGNIWAVWHTGQTGNRDIYIGKLTAGAESFGDSVQIANDDADQCNPVIAIDSDNMLYVAWQDSRNGEWDIYVSTSTDGTTWTAERKITDPNSDQINPAIVIDSSNKAYIVWEDDRNNNRDIYIASSSNGFASTTTSRITSNASDQTTPAIAVDSGDTVYVVWTDTRGGTDDIYGADSTNGPWTNVAVVSKANNQSSPVIAAEASGTILHLLWVDDTSGNNDIYYASSNGLPGSSLTGRSLIDDSSSASQSAPVITVTGSTGNGLKVFAFWQDERNVSGSNGDTDIYFVQANSGSSTNVLVGDNGTNSTQSELAMCVDTHGHPYIVWSDDRNTNTDIYYAGSTFVQSTALESEDVSMSSGATVGTSPAAISSVDDVSVIIPAGAYSCDVKITISEISNPPAFTMVCLGAYDFGPSGIEFSLPVTVTIPYIFTGSEDSVLTYWYNSLTDVLSQNGITDVETVKISSTLHALRFKTTHFTPFYIFLGGGAAAAAGGGGGGGGGCSMSPNGQGSIVEFLLPYIGLAVVMTILKMQDKRKRKMRDIAKSG